MIRRIRPLLTAALLTLAAICTPALSQDAGWFAGLGIGQLRTDDACAGGAGPSFTCDHKNTAWKIFGGYQLNAYFGFELGLVDFGEAPASFAGFGPATARTRVVEALLVGTVPLSQRLAVFGKAGIFQWDMDFEMATGFVGSADASGKDHTYGLGLKYGLSRNVGVRLEWQRYNKVGDPATTGVSDVDFLGVGALLRF